MAFPTSQLGPAARPIAVLLLAVLAVGVPGAEASSPDEPWWEESGERGPYDLVGKRILVVIGNDFDVRETVEVARFWRGWGAAVTVAGNAASVTGHVWRRTGAGWDRGVTETLATDLRLIDARAADYDAIFFPGGASPHSLLADASSDIQRLVAEAGPAGTTLAAICHGPLILAATGIVAGRRVTGHPDVAADVTRAGGQHVTAVVVTDGHLVTGNWPYFESFAAAVAERILPPGSGGTPSRFLTDPVLRAIDGCRPARGFAVGQVDDLSLSRLLRAATLSPAGDGAQPWRFVVVRERGVKERLLRALLAALAPTFERQGISPEAARAYWAAQWVAPALVFAYSHLSEEGRPGPSAGSARDAASRAVAAACQNLSLAAVSEGLATVWLTEALAVESEARAIFAAPQSAHLEAVLAIGRPEAEPLPQVRRPLSELAFMDSWGTRFSPPPAR